MKPDLSTINNIIFDLGGVILNIDPHLTVQEMQKLGISNFSEIYSKFKQDAIFDKLEKGEITEQEFVKLIQENSGIDANPAEIIQSWNKLLLDYPPERIKLLKHLKNSSRWRTFLLSNTNEIHKKAYNQVIKEQFGINGLEELFEKAYFSHEIHMRKPDREIFEFVLNDSGLKAEKTLFVDDSPINIEGAEKLGLKTFHIDGKNSITDLFDSV